MDRVAYELFERLESEHWWFRGRQAIFLDLLERLLPRSRPIRSLDVGCGYGAMIAELERYGPASGVDLFAEAVEHCRRRGFERVYTGSAYSLPAEEASFDLVSFFDCLEHLDDDVAALREGRRVLEATGHVAVSVPAYGFLYANNDRIAHHKRRYTLPQLRSRLETAGFEVRKATYLNTLLFPIILPLVLAKKLKERFLPRADDPTTNLSHSVPSPLNEALFRTFAFERILLRRMSLPFGHSIFALARARPVASAARTPARPSGRRQR